jgi:hypothetical protein
MRLGFAVVSAAFVVASVAAVALATESTIITRCAPGWQKRGRP